MWVSLKNFLSKYTIYSALLKCILSRHLQLKRKFHMDVGVAMTHLFVGEKEVEGTLRFYLLFSLTLVLSKCIKYLLTMSVGDLKNVALSVLLRYCLILDPQEEAMNT